MLLTVGRVVRPHGVRGEVVVEVRTDEPEARYVPGAVLRTEQTGQAARTGQAGQTGRTALTVRSVRPHQGRLIVAFEGVPDRTAAEPLRGTLLQVDSESVAAPSDPDEFHDHQLIGLAVIDPAGEPLGEVVRIDHAPAADLLVLARPGGRTALVPFVAAIVREVEPAGGRIVIDPPPGLFDL